MPQDKSKEFDSRWVIQDATFSAHAGNNNIFTFCHKLAIYVHLPGATAHKHYLIILQKITQSCSHFLWKTWDMK